MCAAALGGGEAGGPLTPLNEVRRVGSRETYLGCWAVPRTPASPTTPIAYPAARPLIPTLRPAPRWRKLLDEKKQERENWRSAGVGGCFNSSHSLIT